MYWCVIVFGLAVVCWMGMIRCVSDCCLVGCVCFGFGLRFEFFLVLVSLVRL